MTVELWIAVSLQDVLRIVAPESFPVDSVKQTFAKLSSSTCAFCKTVSLSGAALVHECEKFIILQDACSCLLSTLVLTWSVGPLWCVVTT